MSNSAKPASPSRRKFLVRGALGTLGVVALGTYVFRNPLRRQIISISESLVPPYSGSGTEPNLWFEITTDNRIRLYSPKVEMGQGVFTGLAQIAADELDVNVDQIEVIGAPTSSGIVDRLSTGGSLSIASLWMPLREMAATMRAMIKAEAARKMGVDIASLSSKEGIISSGDRLMTYAEAAAGVSSWDVPPTPALRDVKDYQFVGQPLARVDLQAKVFGDPIFGLDAEMKDMLHATVIRPQHIGARKKEVNADAARQMPGVVEIVEHDHWVGVIAESFPQALAARNEINISWDIPKKWTESEIRDMLQVGKGHKMITQKQGSALDPDAEGVFSLSFSSPLGAHAQLEPNAAVAWVEEDKATIILSTQVIGITRDQVAKALDMEKRQVNIIPTYLGGGFGRRLNTSHAVEAALLSKAVGRPVKYTFTRQEEFQHDYFRPPTHHIMRGKLGKDGYLSALEHHYASGDVAIGALNLPPVLHTILGSDLGAMRGGNIMYDQIPDHRAVQWHTTLPFATSWWRSLGLLANTFAIESFVDEMALKAGMDPAAFRLARISDDGNGARLKSVISTAAQKTSYTDEIKDGIAMGLAASIDTGTPCAQVAEVSIEDGMIRVQKVTCVMDCGLAVNPDQVKAQCEGAIIMGMSAAMYEQMTIIDGQLQPTIYGPYAMALMKDAPREIEVHLLQGVDEPMPVGEPPLGPIAAAIGNAIRRLTGQRLTNLPLTIG